MTTDLHRATRDVPCRQTALVTRARTGLPADRRPLAALLDRLGFFAASAAVLTLRAERVSAG
jgi:hypothetical protein